MMKKLLWRQSTRFSHLEKIDKLLLKSLANQKLTSYQLIKKLSAKKVANTPIEFSNAFQTIRIIRKGSIRSNITPETSRQ